MHKPREVLPFASKAGRRMPVTALSIDYEASAEIRPHQHDVCQLVYAVTGVMVVSTVLGQWVLPATRAVWIPAQVEHSIRMVGHVAMRTLYIRPSAKPALPTLCSVVAVSRLLRELILEATQIKLPYPLASRDGRLMRLLLDEIVQMRTLPLSLPATTDRRLRIIENAIRQSPDEQTTLGEWSVRLGVDPKTIQRLFFRETGLSFARWRQQARLQQAVEMLAKGERIIDISLAVGYSSPTAFSTMFQRHFGCSPSAFFVRDGTSASGEPFNQGTPGTKR